MFQSIWHKLTSPRSSPGVILPKECEDLKCGGNQLQTSQPQTQKAKGLAGASRIQKKVIECSHHESVVVRESLGGDFDETLSRADTNVSFQTEYGAPTAEPRMLYESPSQAQLLNLTLPKDQNRPSQTRPQKFGCCPATQSPKVGRLLNQTRLAAKSKFEAAEACGQNAQLGSASAQSAFSRRKAYSQKLSICKGPSFCIAPQSVSHSPQSAVKNEAAKVCAEKGKFQSSCAAALQNSPLGTSISLGSAKGGRVNSRSRPLTPCERKVADHSPTVKAAVQSSHSAVGQNNPARKSTSCGKKAADHFPTAKVVVQSPYSTVGQNTHMSKSASLEKKLINPLKTGKVKVQSAESATRSSTSSPRSALARRKAYSQWHAEKRKGSSLSVPAQRTSPSAKFFSSQEKINTGIQHDCAKELKTQSLKLSSKTSTSAADCVWLRRKAYGKMLCEKLKESSLNVRAQQGSALAKSNSPSKGSGPESTASKTNARHPIRSSQYPGHSALPTVSHIKPSSNLCYKKEVKVVKPHLPSEPSLRVSKFTYARRKAIGECQSKKLKGETFEIASKSATQPLQPSSRKKIVNDCQSSLLKSKNVMPSSITPASRLKSAWAKSASTIERQKEIDRRNQPSSLKIKGVPVQTARSTSSMGACGTFAIMRSLPNERASTAIPQQQTDSSPPLQTQGRRRWSPPRPLVFAYCAPWSRYTPSTRTPSPQSSRTSPPSRPQDEACCDPFNTLESGVFDIQPQTCQYQSTDSDSGVEGAPEDPRDQSAFRQSREIEEDRQPRCPLGQQRECFRRRGKPGLNNDVWSSFSKLHTMQELNNSSNEFESEVSEDSGLEDQIQSCVQSEVKDASTQTKPSLPRGWSSDQRLHLSYFKPCVSLGSDSPSGILLPHNSLFDDEFQSSKIQSRTRSNLSDPFGQSLPWEPRDVWYDDQLQSSHFEPCVRRNHGSSSGWPHWIDSPDSAFDEPFGLPFSPLGMRTWGHNFSVQPPSHNSQTCDLGECDSCMQLQPEHGDLAEPLVRWRECSFSQNELPATGSSHDNRSARSKLHLRHLKAQVSTFSSALDIMVRGLLPLKASAFD